VSLLSFLLIRNAPRLFGVVSSGKMGWSGDWETYVASVQTNGNAALLLHFLRHPGGVRLSMVVGGR